MTLRMRGLLHTWLLPGATSQYTGSREAVPHAQQKKKTHTNFPLFFFHLPVAVSCMRLGPPMQCKQGNTSSCLSCSSFVQITWQLKTAFPLPRSYLALHSLRQGSLYAYLCRTDNPSATNQHPASSTQHPDHNTVRKSPSAPNPEHPMCQRKPSWFCVSFLQASLLGNFPDLFLPARTNTLPLSPCTAIFPPFLHRVKAITAQGTGHARCCDLSFA